MEDDYCGPRLDHEITSEFMDSLVQWFRDRKILHKKYAYKIILRVYKLLKSLPSLIDISIPEVSTDQRFETTHFFQESGINIT